MEDLVFEATAATPLIKLNFKEKKISFVGESFPENAIKFYEPIINWIKGYLEELDDTIETVVDFEIIYFNSSTSKIYMMIFSLLDAAVEDGKKITINWIVDENNETAIECGEEFQEDMENIEFNIVVKK